MRRFYAPSASFTEGKVTLDAGETRHLRDVLRLTVDDQVSVFDGEGGEFRCAVRAVGKKSSELIVIEKSTPASPESPLALTVAATILKGEKFDLVIQKAVELGVAEIVPLKTIRCEVKLAEAGKRMERWRRIALEATKQSGRARLLRIGEPVDFSSLMAREEHKNMVLFSEREGKSFSSVTGGTRITALIGPTGGWDETELEEARSHGVTIVTLGGRILRAETASISVASILQHRFGDLN